jgi:hypothetical protein
MQFAMQGHELAGPGLQRKRKASERLRLAEALVDPRKFGYSFPGPPCYLTVYPGIEQPEFQVGVGVKPCQNMIALGDRLGCSK